MWGKFTCFCRKASTSTQSWSYCTVMSFVRGGTSDATNLFFALVRDHELDIPLSGDMSNLAAFHVHTISFGKYFLEEGHLLKNV